MQIEKVWAKSSTNPDFKQQIKSELVFKNIHSWYDHIARGRLLCSLKYY